MVDKVANEIVESRISEGTVRMIIQAVKEDSSFDVLVESLKRENVESNDYLFTTEVLDKAIKVLISDRAPGYATVLEALFDSNYAGRISRRVIETAFNTALRSVDSVLFHSITRYYPRLSESIMRELSSERRGLLLTEFRKQSGVESKEEMD